jgi:MFS family permease
VAGILLFLGPALGPTVGGALIGAAGWRAIFLINVPAGAVAAVAVRYVPAALAPERQPGARGLPFPDVTSASCAPALSSRPA